METKIPREVTLLKQEGAASAREVRDFIGRMRGKSPQEVLGMVAQSSLVSGVTIATLATVALIAAFTVGPYLLRDKKAVAKPAAAPVESKSAPPSTTSAPTSDSAATSPKTTEASTPDKTILEKLEMDEVKQTDPSANPLEEKGDDLLNELR